MGLIAFDDQMRDYLPARHRTGHLRNLMRALDVRPVVALVIAISGAVAIQFAFGRLLLVPLPRNPFFDLPW